MGALLSKSCIKVLYIFVIAASFIFVYWLLLRKGGNVSKDDRFNRVVLRTFLFGDLSWWPIFHFIIFAVVGFLFPCCDVLAISLGILWEVWENIFGKYILKEKKFFDDPSIQYITWWQWSMNDVLLNILGFYFGKLIRMTVI